MNAMTQLAPRITTMIRMDHTHVVATFHRYTADTSNDRKQALAETICAALEIHATLEEEIFYPALRDRLPELIGESEREHQNMRRLIASLREMTAGEPDFDDTVMELMREVFQHVAEEETRVLPTAERVLGDQLEALGWQMTRRRVELVGPRAGEIAVNVARSYPGMVMTGAALALVGAFFVARGGYQRTTHRTGAARRLLGHRH